MNFSYGFGVREGKSKNSMNIASKNLRRAPEVRLGVFLLLGLILLGAQAQASPLADQRYMALESEVSKEECDGKFDVATDLCYSHPEIARAKAMLSTSAGRIRSGDMQGNVANYSDTARNLGNTWAKIVQDCRVAKGQCERLCGQVKDEFSQQISKSPPGGNTAELAKRREVAEKKLNYCGAQLESVAAVHENSARDAMSVSAQSDRTANSIKKEEGSSNPMSYAAMAMPLASMMMPQGGSQGGQQGSDAKESKTAQQPDLKKQMGVVPAAPVKQPGQRVASPYKQPTETEPYNYNGTPGNVTPPNQGPGAVVGTQPLPNNGGTARVAYVPVVAERTIGTAGVFTNKIREFEGGSSASTTASSASRYGEPRTPASETNSDPGIVSQIGEKFMNGVRTIHGWIFSK